MANTLIQGANQVETIGSSTGTTLSSNVTAGNLLVIGVLCNNTDNTINTPTDNLSNTWTALGSAQSQASVGLSRLFYAIAGSTGSLTVQVSITPGAGGGGYKETVLAEYNGPTTLDTSSSALDSGVTMTPAAAGELAVALVCSNASDTAAGSGWALAQDGTSAVLGKLQLIHDLDAGSAGGSESVNITGSQSHYEIHGALFGASNPAYYYPGGANVTTGTWTTSTGSGTLASMIDEPTTYDDSDYIQSASNPSTDTCEIPLLNVQAPSTNTGHVIRYRLKSDASCPQVVKLIAGDGTTVVKTWSHTGAGLGVPASSFTTYNQTLSTGEADAWAAAGYPGSRLRFTAN